MILSVKSKLTKNEEETPEKEWPPVKLYKSAHGLDLNEPEVIKKVKEEKDCDIVLLRNTRERKKRGRTEECSFAEQWKGGWVPFSGVL